VADENLSDAPRRRSCSYCRTGYRLPGIARGVFFLTLRVREQVVRSSKESAAAFFSRSVE
jgi:hypothetical protein